MPPPLPPDSGDSPDPEGIMTVLTPEAAVFSSAGIPPETCDVKDGDWTRTKPSAGVGALFD